MAWLSKSILGDRPDKTEVRHQPALESGAGDGYRPSRWDVGLYQTGRRPAIEKGQLVLPTKPGLGLKFDDKAVAAYRVV
jgi:hypothetical protein